MNDKETLVLRREINPFQIYQEQQLVPNLGQKPSKLDLAINKSKEIYNEGTFNKLLEVYLTQKSLTEKYEKVIEEADSKVASLITRFSLILGLILITVVFLLSH